MPDSFVQDFVGQRVCLVLVSEAGQWHGTLQEVGERWIKVLVGKSRATLIPIVNVRSISVESEPANADAPQQQR